MSSDPHYYQRLFWRELVQLKAQMSYFGHYAAECERIDRALNVLTAFASSGTIAAWVIWEKAALAWGIIIAGAQAVNAVGKFLPYQKRLKAIYGIGAEFARLFVMAQQDWYDVAEGILSNAEIHEKTMNLRSRKAEAGLQHLTGLSLPVSRRILRRARESTRAYFATMYEEEPD